MRKIALTIALLLSPILAYAEGAKHYVAIHVDQNDPAVMNMALNKLVPESWPYVHTCEGPDDMPAHIKAALTDSSVTIPIGEGRLLTGTWQGIYLCEHRDHGGRRRLVVTIQGSR